MPNTFYMLTDLIHLNQFTFDFYVQLNIMEWLYFTYLLLGVFLAMYCMILIFINLMHFTSKLWINRTLIVVLMFLNGLGIYMGRFLRFHTVHLITEPFTIIRQVIASLNTQSITFILLMVLLQTVIIIFVKGESGKMIWHIMILLIIIIALQLIIGHFFHKMVLV